MSEDTAEGIVLSNESQEIAKNTLEEPEKLIQQLFQEHLRVINLAKTYKKNPKYNSYANGKAFEEPNRFAAYYEVQEVLPEFFLPNVMICVADYGDDPAEYSDNVGIEASVRLDIPLYTDLDTIEDYIRYVNETGDRRKEYLRTYYFYNTKGEFKKIQQTNLAFDSGKEEVYRTERAHGFISDITPGDYEIVRTSLKHAEAGFTEAVLKALTGRNDLVIRDGKIEPSD